MNKKSCILLENEQQLNELIHNKKNFFILFYADWCPFSQRFLPVFENCTKETSYQCYRMIIDEDERLCTKYSVDVFPTVIFFEKGNVSQRLDGIHGIGLNEKQLKDLLSSCQP